MNRNVIIVATLALVVSGVIYTATATQYTTANPDNHARTRQPALAVATGIVQVTGGLSEITSRIDGQVEEVNAEEGDRIRSGQTLLMLDSTDAKINVAIADAELAKVTAARKAMERKLAFAKRHSQTIRKAADAGVSSGATADETEVQVEELEAALRDSTADVEIAKQRLDQARLALERCNLQAPLAGVIVRRDVRVGDNIAAADRKVLFEILPGKPLIVRAEVNEAFIDSIRPGMEAELVRDDDSVLQKARVIRVGGMFSDSRLPDQLEQQGYTRSVECILAVADTGLRVGQQVRVRFVPGQERGGTVVQK